MCCFFPTDTEKEDGIPVDESRWVTCLAANVFYFHEMMEKTEREGGNKEQDLAREERWMKLSFVREWMGFSIYL